MINPGSRIPDENALEMPRSWKRHLHPRRGGASGPEITISDLEEGDLRSPYAADIEKVLGHDGTDPALAAAGREHMAGTATPLGAAVIAAVPDSESYHGETTVRFVDSWITTFGAAGQAGRAHPGPG
ncbi:hypothetical protein ACFY4C_32065 [Actinomadura viridis]|uniref:hypothetical protein n=1 Tax=Actinomadura viridis TaxID=58110 RepID=UPI00368330E0